MSSGIVQLPAGSWWSMLIGALLLLLLLTWLLLAASHHRQRHHAAGAPLDTSTAARAAPPAPSARAKQRQIEKDRSAWLIAEAVLVRERLAGQIDTSTYQAGMHKLATGPQR